MPNTIGERRVSYWAVQGERWCNVDRMITEKLAADWEQAGWKIVTRITNTEAPVYGAIEEVYECSTNG